VLRLFRATYPLAALPFFYDAVEHMSRLVTMNYYDAEIIQVEEAIFHCQPSQILYKALPWLPLSELLHLAYALYILLVPIAVLALVLKRRDEALRVFTTTVLGTYFVCYLSFTFFPVNGPFQNMGAIDPAAKGVFFPQLVQRMLERGSSLGTAFPSSHVAVAIAIWLVTRRTVGKLSILFLAAWVGILVGVVYGGYHYAVDAIAGLAVGIACGLFWPRFHQWAARRLGATWAMTGAGQQPAVENSPRGRRADAGVA
jgi:membrane-associated phospholipid phosphatase